MAKGEESLDGCLKMEGLAEVTVGGERMVSGGQLLCGSL